MLAQSFHELSLSTPGRGLYEITDDIAKAEQFAENSPYPADEELYNHVYAD